MDSIISFINDNDWFLHANMTAGALGTIFLLYNVLKSNFSKSLVRSITLGFIFGCLIIVGYELGLFFYYLLSIIKYGIGNWDSFYYFTLMGFIEKTKFSFQNIFICFILISLIIAIDDILLKANHLPKSRSSYMSVTFLFLFFLALIFFLPDEPSFLLSGVGIGFLFFYRRRISKKLTSWSIIGISSLLLAITIYLVFRTSNNILNEPSIFAEQKHLDIDISLNYFSRSILKLSKYFFKDFCFALLVVILLNGSEKYEAFSRKGSWKKYLILFLILSSLIIVLPILVYEIAQRNSYWSTDYSIFILYGCLYVFGILFGSGCLIAYCGILCIKIIKSIKIRLRYNFQENGVIPLLNIKRFIITFITTFMYINIVLLCSIYIQTWQNVFIDSISLSYPDETLTFNPSVPGNQFFSLIEEALLSASFWEEIFLLIMVVSSLYGLKLWLSYRLAKISDTGWAIVGAILVIISILMPLLSNFG